MNVNSIKSSVFNSILRSAGGHDIGCAKVLSNYGTKNIQNTASTSSNFMKKMKFQFRKLSDYMKEPSEMTNALIAMIGTGLIAPFAIMYSPKKKCCNKNQENVDREKKFFQALRQPVSAFLQFAFQVPTTVGIAMGLNHLAYKKHAKLFEDKVLGNLIPGKKYLKNEALKVLNGKASAEIQKEWEKELGMFSDETKIKAEYMDKIRQEYKEVGLEVSEKELEKLAGNNKKLTKFKAEKMASAKHDNMLNEKISLLKKKKPAIKELDLVTEDYQNLAKNRFENDFSNLKKKAKLNWFDKFLQSMGFSNKKLNKLGKEEKALAKEKGLILLKEDLPDVFKNETTKLKLFAENKNAQAQKIFKNKIFWISLVTNLFMVATSCVALNWLHPKFAHYIDKMRGKNEPTPSTEKKAEVKA